MKSRIPKSSQSVPLYIHIYSYLGVLAFYEWASFSFPPKGSWRWLSFCHVMKESLVPTRENTAYLHHTPIQGVFLLFCPKNDQVSDYIVNPINSPQRRALTNCVSVLLSRRAISYCHLVCWSIIKQFSKYQRFNMY